MEDLELLKRIQCGELQYLNPLIERYYDSICKYCYWKTRNTETAQDISQETFCRFFKNLGNYTHYGKCKADLYF